MKEIALKVVVVILLVVLLSLPILFLQHMKEMTGQNRLRCIQNAHNLGAAIELYLDDYGRFPEGGWDESHSCPRWVWQMRDWYAIEFHKLDADQWVKKYLKCPADASSSLTSYEINSEVLGKTPSDIGSREIVIFKEKHSRVSHQSECRIYINASEASQKKKM